jgi:hypothetical protein
MVPLVKKNRISVLEILPHYVTTLLNYGYPQSKTHRHGKTWQLFPLRFNSPLKIYLLLYTLQSSEVAIFCYFRIYNVLVWASVCCSLVLHTKREPNIFYKFQNQ